MSIPKKSLALSMSFSLTAMILYLPANFFPFMSIELYGNRNTSTIWGGIVTLSEGGSWPIALIVFLASIVIPFVKLLILFYLGLTAHNGQHPHWKAKLYNFIEVIGRWSMLDIYLLAVLVAILKLGPWTTVEPQAGSYMFALVVIFTMLASASFDPTTIEEKSDVRKV
jgi:paraquat-inducible protein A